MRALLVPLLVLGCEAAEKSASPPRPAMAPQPAKPAGPHLIEWQVGGLGSWKGQAVTGIMWHVAVDLEKTTIAITDPGGVTSQRALAPDVAKDYARLARAVSEAPPYKPSNGCTDRSETLRIDNVVLSDTCPIAQRDAAALTAMLGRELE
jgi:hypothetical protein